MVDESSVSLTQESVTEAEKSLETALSEDTTLEFEDGRLEVAMRFRNLSERSVKLRDLTVIAFRLDRLSNRFSVVGTLTPSIFQPDDSPEQPSNPQEPSNDAVAALGEEDASQDVIVGPRDEILFTASNDTLNPDVVEPLLRRPSSLVFRTGALSASEVNAAGETLRDFSAVGQNVVERNALILIDFGDGRVERHFVATNVERESTGRGAGITMKEALEGILQINYEASMTKPSSDGQRASVQVLSRIRDRRFSVPETPPQAPDPDLTVCDPDWKGSSREFWTAIGSSPDFSADKDFDGEPDQTGLTDFDDIRLRSGDIVSLTYLSDLDADGLFEREEGLFGTDPTSEDSDGDGLRDGCEVNEGWVVEVFEEVPNRENRRISTRTVFSDPRFPDADGDLLADQDERIMKTDPNNPDTDGDGAPDGADADGPTIRKGSTPHASNSGTDWLLHV